MVSRSSGHNYLVHASKCHYYRTSLYSQAKEHFHTRLSTHLNPFPHASEKLFPQTGP
uniref:Uncharacterized protein n=1 Tax=Arundo donax TaxID=35708 RepID=A0A0A8Y7P7_ARUDO